MERGLAVEEHHVTILKVPLHNTSRLEEGGGRIDEGIEISVESNESEEGKLP